jgi:hypothetical protein
MYNIVVNMHELRLYDKKLRTATTAELSRTCVCMYVSFETQYWGDLLLLVIFCASSDIIFITVNKSLNIKAKLAENNAKYLITNEKHYYGQNLDKQNVVYLFIAS